MLEILLRVRKEYRGQHQEALGFLSPRFLGALGLLPSTEHWALAMDAHVGWEVLPWWAEGPSREEGDCTVIQKLRGTRGTMVTNGHF